MPETAHPDFRTGLAALAGGIDRKETSLALLLVLSGFIGAVWGLATAGFQISVEASQVVNGLVRYDPSSPVYTMHISLFTGFIYVQSLLLALTSSEAATSAIVCALIGIVAMQTLAMVIFVGVRNVYLAVLSAVVAVPIHLFGYGIAYPIIFMGTSHANGRIGFFFAVFAVLFFAFSRFRTAFFLSGIALLVHPSWGMFVGSCLAVVLATGFRYLRPLVSRENLVAYFSGVGISVAGVVVHKLLFPLPHESNVDTVGARRLFSAYIRNWDYHRQRFDDPGNLIRELSYAAVALTLGFVMLRRRNSTLGEKLFAHFMIVATLLGTVFVFVPSWFSPDVFPEALIVLMPGRFINISLFVALPLLVGTLLRGMKTIPHLVAVAAVWAVLMYLARFNPVPVRIGEREFSLMLTALLFGGIHYFRRNDVGAAKSEYGITNRFLAAGVLGLVLSSPVLLMHQLPTIRENFRSVTVPPVAGRVLTTAENYALQAKARVPTFTPLLDGFPHTGEGTLLTVNREMRDIYGIALSDEPPRAKGLHRGMLITDDYRELWGARPCTEWERIAGQYKIGLIITPPTLPLRLPRADQDPEWNKYYPRCSSPARN